MALDKPISRRVVAGLAVALAIYIAVVAFGSNNSEKVVSAPLHQAVVATNKATPPVEIKPFVPTILASFDLPFSVRPDSYDRNIFGAEVVDFDLSEDKTRIYFPWSPNPESDKPAEDAHIYIYDISNPKNITSAADIRVGKVVPYQVVVRGNYLFLLQRNEDGTRGIEIYLITNHDTLTAVHYIENTTMLAMGVSADVQWILGAQLGAPSYLAYNVADINHPYVTASPNFTDPYTYRFHTIKIYPFSKNTTAENWKKAVTPESVNLKAQAKLNARFIADRADNTLATYQTVNVPGHDSFSQYAITLWDVASPEAPQKTQILKLPLVPSIGSIRLLAKTHAVLTSSFNHLVFYSTDSFAALNCGDTKKADLCKNDDISSLDQEVAGLYLYDFYAAYGKQRKMFFDDQMDWLTQGRQACDASELMAQVDCWKERYFTRSVILQKVIEDYGIRQAMQARPLVIKRHGAPAALPNAASFNTVVNQRIHSHPSVHR